MSQEKAQLIAPIDSSFTVPGLTVSGVITATTFDGTITGVANSITQGKNLNVGVVTALSFAGNLTGNAGGLTGSPNTVAGVVTATSFVGGLTGNITGDVIGNATGVGASIKQGGNLNVGIATAWKWYGDASAVTGVGATAFIAQEVTGTGDETIINLTHGNLIYYKGDANTTVGFASTAATQEVTIVRDTDPNYSISISTGGVTFDGTDDILQTSTSTDYQLGTSSFTVEAWIYNENPGENRCIAEFSQGTDPYYGPLFLYQNDSGATYKFWASSNGSSWDVAAGQSFGAVVADKWEHFAIVRDGNTFYGFRNGEQKWTFTSSASLYQNVNQITIGRSQSTIGSTPYFEGKISNFRFVKGTALYTTDFVPPSAALTNVTNTELLCCQSDSSATTAAVGSVSATSSPTAGAQTISLSGSLNATITWPDRVKWSGGSAPTLISNARTKAFQVFRFTTVDTGLNYNAWEEMKNNAETFGLYGAGPSGYGALGTNYAPSPSIYRSSPVQVPGTSWSSLIDTAWVGGVGGAIKSDGTMWVWGKTNWGILGLNVYGAGLSNSVSSPIQLGTETTWESACFGGNNNEVCMAIKTDGTLWGWGQNRYGNLAQNDHGSPGSLPNEYLTSRSSPVQVGTDTTWKWVNPGGEDVILAIKTDGTLWRWGGNPVGAGGDNLPGTSPARRSSPVQVGTDTSWAYAWNNRNGTSIATKTDGTLWCWGDNSKGQCGQNTNAASSYSGFSSPTQVGTDTDWNYDNGSKIVAGYQRVFAIKTNGTLWGWGRTAQGQLGLNEGGYKDYSSPTQIPGTNWATIKNVGEVIATKTDGTLWTWGDNGEGKGMLNSDVDRSSPTQVPGTWYSGDRGIRSGSPQFALKVE